MDPNGFGMDDMPFNANNVEERSSSEVDETACSAQDRAFTKAYLAYLVS